MAGAQAKHISLPDCDQLSGLVPQFLCLHGLIGFPQYRGVGKQAQGCLIGSAILVQPGAAAGLLSHQPQQLPPHRVDRHRASSLTGARSIC
mgnify:CR=1 FL=1